MNAREAFREVWEKAVEDQALSERTGEAYWWWVKRFVRVTKKRSSATWTGEDWEGFERWLIAEKYSYSSRRQARSALDFVFADVLKLKIGKLDLPRLPKGGGGLPYPRAGRGRGAGPVCGYGTARGRKIGTPCDSAAALQGI